MRLLVLPSYLQGDSRSGFLCAFTDLILQTSSTDAGASICRFLAPSWREALGHAAEQMHKTNAQVLNGLEALNVRLNRIHRFCHRPLVVSRVFLAKAAAD